MKNRLARFFICLIPLGLIAFLPVKAVWAADEDIDPSVYLVFDPATGEFTTVDDTEANQSGMAAGKANPSENSGSSANTSTAATSTTGTGQSSASSPTSTADGSGLSPIWIGSAVTLVLLGGIVFYTRRNQHKLSS